MLTECSRVELNQSAKLLFRHNLTGVLESAIISSNAQFDDADVLKRIDVRLLEVRMILGVEFKVSENDIGWDVFSLEYHLSTPLSTIITPQCMSDYLRVSNFLWKLKRVEYFLTKTWKKQATLNRHHRHSLPQSFHHCQLAMAQMIHFVSQFQYYFLFEVLEYSWNLLHDRIDNGIHDLDAFVGAHGKFCHFHSRRLIPLDI